MNCMLTSKSVLVVRKLLSIFSTMGCQSVRAILSFDLCSARCPPIRLWPCRLWYSCTILSSQVRQPVSLCTFGKIHLAPSQILRIRTQTAALFLAATTRKTNKTNWFDSLAMVWTSLTLDESVGWFSCRFGMNKTNKNAIERNANNIFAFDSLSIEFVFVISNFNRLKCKQYLPKQQICVQLSKLRRMSSATCRNPLSTLAGFM